MVRISFLVGDTSIAGIPFPDSGSFSPPKGPPQPPLVGVHVNQQEKAPEGALPCTLRCMTHLVRPGDQTSGRGLLGGVTPPGINAAWTNNLDKPPCPLDGSWFRWPSRKLLRYDGDDDLDHHLLHDGEQDPCDLRCRFLDPWCLVRSCLCYSSRTDVIPSEGVLDRTVGRGYDCGSMALRQQQSQT